MHASFIAPRPAGPACVADARQRGGSADASAMPLPLPSSGGMPRWVGWAAAGGLHAALLFALMSAFAPVRLPTPQSLRISARLLPSATAPAANTAPTSVPIELPRSASQLPPAPDIPVPVVQIEAAPATASIVEPHATSPLNARPSPAAAIAVTATTVIDPPPATPTPSETPATWSADHRECSERQTTRHYPALLRDRGIQGRVMLRVKVDADGHASEVVVSGGSGWRLLDEAARRVAEACPFIPARRGDQRVASWVEYPVRFALQASPLQ